LSSTEKYFNEERTTTMAGDFVMSRVFDAPRELMWKCFTEPERMKQWWGPKGFAVIASKMDLQVGGNISLRHEGARRLADVGQVRIPGDCPARAHGLHQLVFR
jgi:uncharacterized protein YndB with AHSA1/START domain